MSPKTKTASALASLRLIRSEGVGPSTFQRLTATFGTAANAIDALPNMKRPLQAADLKTVQTEYDALLKRGGHWLSQDDGNYPQTLQGLDDAPPVLSALGNLDLLTKPALAIVGARNASVNGRKLAARIAHDLGQAGYVIVSGLARGIDAAAHEAALDTGTIAVLANGVDVVYPPENKKLYDAICERGLVVSENPLGCEPAASLFPRRNRIVSGLSQAVILIEAAAKSGSLIMTRFALDQGRDVFAVPGHPMDPRATGPNSLIKSGQAHLIESAEDVLNILHGLRSLDNPSAQITFALDQVELYAPPQQANGAAATNDQARQLILECLGATPCTIDQIAFATNLATPQILSVLMELELTGRLQRLAGDRVTLL